MEDIPADHQFVPGATGPGCIENGMHAKVFSRAFAIYYHRVMPVVSRPRLLSLLLPASCSSSRDARFLQVLFIPAEVALKTITVIAWTLDTVKLIWVDNQLGVDPETTECLIHLLTPRHRDTEGNPVFPA